MLSDEGVHPSLSVLRELRSDDEAFKEMEEKEPNEVNEKVRKRKRHASGGDDHGGHKHRKKDKKVFFCSTIFYYSPAFSNFQKVPACFALILLGSSKLQSKIRTFFTFFPD